MAVESLTNARENLPNVYTNITARAERQKAMLENKELFI